jgi:hypothetical protein
MRNLQKPRAQRGQPIQIGFHGGDIAPVSFRKCRRLGLRQGGERQQKGCGKQGAAEHGTHVDRLTAKGKAPALA